MSDAELTHIAAFGFGGSDAASGVLLIGGTGSIALARPVGNPHAIIRAGGLGFKFGDEGSGHWIGLKMLEQCSTTPDLELALCNELNVMLSIYTKLSHLLLQLPWIPYVPVT